MGGFGAVFGRRGDAGFKVPLLGVSSGVVGFNVATLSRLVREKVRPAWPDVCVSAKKFALLGLMVGVSAKKFALHAQNTPISAFLRLLGEFFRGSAAGGGVLGEFFRGSAAGGACRAKFFAEEPLVGVCWASFFAEVPLEGVCWASFFADRQSWDPTGRTLLRRSPGLRPSTGSVNPSMRSYTHLVEAGHGRPTRPRQPAPQRKALTKGKCLPVKAVTSLDNGRKWRVYAGRTLELLR